MERSLSFQTRILSSPNSSGLRFSGGVLDFDVHAIQTRSETHGNPLERVRCFGARINALPSYFDPEVSYKNALTPLFGMTHTSFRAVLCSIDHYTGGILKR